MWRNSRERPIYSCNHGTRNARQPTNAGGLYSTCKCNRQYSRWSGLSATSTQLVHEDRAHWLDRCKFLWWIKSPEFKIIHYADPHVWRLVFSNIYMHVANLYVSSHLKARWMKNYRHISRSSVTIRRRILRSFLIAMTTQGWSLSILYQTYYIVHQNKCWYI